MSLQAYYDPQTDHHLIAVVLVEQELMLVLHEDTLARYEVRPWEPGRYQPREWFWPSVSPREKLLLWGERVEERLAAGLEAQTGDPYYLNEFQAYLLLLGLYGIAAKMPDIAKIAYKDALVAVSVYLAEQVSGNDPKRHGGVESVEEIFALMGKFYERLRK